MIAQSQRAQCPSPKCLVFWIEAESAQVLFLLRQ